MRVREKKEKFFVDSQSLAAVYWAAAYHPFQDGVSRRSHSLHSLSLGFLVMGGIRNRRKKAISKGSTDGEKDTSNLR